MLYVAVRSINSDGSAARPTSYTVTLGTSISSTDSNAAFTPAQQVARNKLRVARSLLRATSCAGVNAALQFAAKKTNAEQQ